MRPLSLKPYLIDIYEVTADAYKACEASGRCQPAGRERECTAGKADRGRHPINCVTWYQASAYCAAQTKRLPSTAEWVFAATAGRGATFPWGNEPPDPKRLNAAGTEYRKYSLAKGFSAADAHIAYHASDGFATTAPVGSFPAGASPFGVHDLAGNVAEWTGSADSDPLGVLTQPGRFMEQRGGDWMSGHHDVVKVDASVGGGPNGSGETIGFRCAKTG